MTEQNKKDFQKSKEMFESFDFDKISKSLNATIEKLPNILTPIKDELIKLKTPVSTKNIKINGENCVISLIEDGRVIIQMSSREKAKNLYDNINVIQNKIPFWKKIFK